ncbi:MAG: aldo/keto reductase [Oscillospiraceae bacterium]|nr:aldo/keto reductase [Oscillospiraceae bacterium]
MKENLIPNITLNNGVKMPALGFGTAMIADDEIPSVIGDALKEGYRYFDCAPEYGNAGKIGAQLRAGDIPREELFIATKLPAPDHGYDKTLRAFDAACEDMGLDYFDLYVIHHPLLDYDAFCESWKAMEKICKQGRARAIGLSGFLEVHLERIFGMCEIPPQADMFECNPFFTITECRKYCAAKGIHVVNWFPLGGPAVRRHSFPREDNTRLLENETLIDIAKERGKTPAQIALCWAVQKGMTPIPKSSKRERMRENREIFDFVLSDVEMHRTDALNYDRRYGLDPMTFNGDYSKG